MLSQNFVNIFVFQFVSWFAMSTQSFRFPDIALPIKIMCFIVLFCLSRFCVSFMLFYVLIRCFPLCSCLPTLCILYLDFVFPGWHFQSRIISFDLLVCFSLVLFCHSGLSSWFSICIFQHIHWHKTRLIDNTIKLLSLESYLAKHWQLNKIILHVWCCQKGKRRNWQI